MSERSKIVTLRHLISRFAPAIPPLSLRATSPDPGESVLKGKPPRGKGSEDFGADCHAPAVIARRAQPDVAIRIPHAQAKGERIATRCALKEAKASRTVSQ